MKSTRGQGRNVVAGMARIAAGRADGLAYFGATPQAFLSSLAPLLAFPLVGALLGMFSQGVLESLTELAMTLCAVLAPPVVSYELARFWKRSGAWLRFATALNWCEWLLPMVAALLMLPLSVAVTMGLDDGVASLVLVGGLSAYGLWLHWFLARQALALTWLRAIVFVIVVNSASVAAVLGPHYIASFIK